MKTVITGLSVLSIGVLAWSIFQHTNNDVTVPAEQFSDQMKPLENDGFSKEGMDAINSNSPTDLLSIDDLPEELRSEIRAELELESANGFGDVSDFDASEIVDIEKFIIGSDFQQLRIPFKPSELPEYIVDHYAYIGYTVPNYSIKKSVVKMQNGTLRRIFKHNVSGDILIIEESSDSMSPRATLLKEAINTAVADLPAIYSVKKSPDGKTYALLSWTTKTFAYVLYQFTDLDNAKQTLVDLGNELTLNN